MGNILGIVPMLHHQHAQSGKKKKRNGVNVHSYYLITITLCPPTYMTIYILLLDVLRRTGFWQVSKQVFYSFLTQTTYGVVFFFFWGGAMFFIVILYIVEDGNPILKLGLAICDPWGPKVKPPVRRGKNNQQLSFPRPVWPHTALLWSLLWQTDNK